MDPDFVLTTVLLLASPTIADVVTGSPSLNDPDPLMKPAMDLSLELSLHFDIVGTPRGALAFLATLSVGVLALGDVTAVVDVVLTDFVPPPIPNREKVGRPLTGGTDMDASFFGVSLACCSAIDCRVNRGDSAPLEGCWLFLA